MIIFALGIRLGFTGKLRDTISVMAFIAAISCSLVGIFPVDDFENHVTVALSFFGMGLITILVVTTLTLMGRPPTCQKPLLFRVLSPQPLLLASCCHQVTCS